MMKAILIFLFCILNLSFISTPGAKWKLVKEDDKINVYNRFCKISNENEVRVSTIIKSSLSDLVYVLQDVNYYTDWVYLCSEAKTIKKISPTEQIYYIITDFPWPIMNRDAVVHGKTSQDPVTKVVSITSTSSIETVAHIILAEQKDS